MGWLDNLYQRGEQAKHAPAPAAVARVRPEPVVQVTWAQTAHANLERGDPGAVILVYYTVDEGALTLVEEDGKAIGKPHALQPGDDPVRIAKRQALARWRTANPNANFNRRIAYAPLGIA